MTWPWWSWRRWPRWSWSGWLVCCETESVETWSWWLQQSEPVWPERKTRPTDSGNLPPPLLGCRNNYEFDIVLFLWSAKIQRSHQQERLTLFVSCRGVSRLFFCLSLHQTAVREREREVIVGECDVSFQTWWRSYLGGDHWLQYSALTETSDQTLHQRERYIHREVSSESGAIIPRRGAGCLRWWQVSSWKL